MTLNSRWFPVAALLFALSLPSFLGAQTLPGEVKVGALETLTGDSSVYGLSIKSGLELAFDQINTQRFLGKTKVKLIVLDEKADKQEGISVMSRLIDEEKVAAVFGPTLSSVAFAADPIAQKAGVPVIGTSTTASGITEMGDYIFRDSLPQSSFVSAPLEAAKARFQIKKAALIFESTNEYSKSESEVFKAALKSLGVDLVATESYSHGDTDFRTQLNKLRLRKPDLLVISALAGEAVPVLQQAREVGFTVPIVGGNGLNSPNVVKVAQSAAEGILVGAAWFRDSPNPRSRAFVEEYKAKYGTVPDQFAAQAYQGAWILATAIKTAGSADRKAVRDALAKIKDLDGVLGKFSFNDRRDPVHPSVTLVVKDGQYTVLQ
jgi:branched-chain amino acid transport system substrate-binding protein